MNAIYYDFKINGENCGFCEVRDDGHEIFMRAVFEMDGATYRNVFGLRYEGDRVLEVRSGDGDWRAFEYPADHYPSAAYPLLLRRLFQQVTYIAVDDESGRIAGPTVLKREHETIVERRRGKLLRTFTMRAGRVVRIDWGGPISDLQPSYAAAVAGSPLAGKEI